MEMARWRSVASSFSAADDEREVEMESWSSLPWLYRHWDGKVATCRRVWERSREGARRFEGVDTTLRRVEHSQRPRSLSLSVCWSVGRDGQGVGKPKWLPSGPMSM
uniref:Uncharacterized protein n=1 Tax=Oryza barthii TaxID=65489 RepID=A0A0D3H3R4_9ORYZ